MPEPAVYLGTSILAGWFGVQPRTVSKWMARHESFPTPDVIVRTDQGHVAGWLPGREHEIRAWKDSLPGQGWRKSR